MLRANAAIPLAVKASQPAEYRRALCEHRQASQVGTFVSLLVLAAGDCSAYETSSSYGQSGSCEVRNVVHAKEAGLFVTRLDRRSRRPLS